MFCFLLVLEFVVQTNGADFGGSGIEGRSCVNSKYLIKINKQRFRAFININYVLDGEESAMESTSRQKRGILQKILFLNAFRNVQIPFLG